MPFFSNKMKKITWFTVPYFPLISDKFKNIFRNSDIKTAFYSLNKLCKFIKVRKHAIPSSSCKNVVCEISYRACVICGIDD